MVAGWRLIDPSAIPGPVRSSDRSWRRAEIFARRRLATRRIHWGSRAESAKLSPNSASRKSEKSLVDDVIRRRSRELLRVLRVHECLGEAISCRVPHGCVCGTPRLGPHLIFMHSLTCLAPDFDKWVTAGCVKRRQNSPAMFRGTVTTTRGSPASWTSEARRRSSRTCDSPFRLFDLRTLWCGCRYGADRSGASSRPRRGGWTAAHVRDQRPRG